MLTRLSEDKKLDGTAVMIYAGSGVGKTFFSAGASSKTVVATDRNGIITLKSKLYKETVGNDPFIIELKPDTNPTAPKAFDEIRNILDGLFASHTIDQWDTLVLDDVNTTRIAARNKGVDLNGFAGRSKTLVNAQSKKFSEQFLLTRADFGTEMGLVESFLREVCDAIRSEGKNLIINAHERLYRKEGSNTITAVKPLFTGTDTPDAMPGIFDLVWYLRTIGAGAAVKRELVTDSEGGIMAKTRWGGLFKNPERGMTAKQMFERIKEYQISQLPPENG